MGKSKKDKLPRGAGRLPEWWLEITPHETLYLAEDEAQRQAEYEEEMKFAELAAREDLFQKYGGEGFPDWNPATMGPRTKAEEKEWVSKGYKRNEKEEWVNEEGAPLEGRQFKGAMPPGYFAGQNSKGGGGGKPGGGGGDLNPTSQYERDKDKAWAQPSWAKVKLRSTGDKGVKEGAKTIVKGDGQRVTPAAEPESEGNEEGIIEGIIGDDEEIEVFEDDDEDIIEEVVGEKELSELQKILKRRQQASG
jgi:hypothetical protein